MIENERESVKVLKECIHLQNKKGQDYQSTASNVVQAMHYRRGIDTIHDIIHGKMMRAQSLLESARAGTDGPNFESIEDTYKDMINYCSFAVTWLRGQMEGQDQSRDIFNNVRCTQAQPANHHDFKEHKMSDETFSSSYARTDSDIYTGAHGGIYK